jgi:hypothetical protein
MRPNPIIQMHIRCSIRSVQSSFSTPFRTAALHSSNSSSSKVATISSARFKVGDGITLLLMSVWANPSVMYCKTEAPILGAVEGNMTLPEVDSREFLHIVCERGQLIVWQSDPGTLHGGRGSRRGKRTLYSRGRF